MLWSRKASPPSLDRTRLVGLDLTASRARAVAAIAGRARTITLDEPAEELALLIALERRHPEVGRAGAAICRKLPHLVCSNFLPLLGQPREWRGTRATLTPETALIAAFEKLRPALVAESDTLGLVLPAYLTPAQVKLATAAAGKARLTIRGTVAAPMALAAHRAADILASKTPIESESPPDDGRPDWVVPIRSLPSGPGAVVIIDADEYALSVAVVQVSPAEVRLLASGYWPKVSLKVWRDRLVDTLSDRCVRLCRRDPRDSADAEQALVEQLEAALHRTRHGHPVTLTVRSAHWYQDLHLQPADLEGYCGVLSKMAVDGVREVLSIANLPVPPRAVWLTDAAGKLPGLAAAIYHNSPEPTQVAILPPTAGAEAAAALLARWLSGGLPAEHLDVVIPLEAPTSNPLPSAEMARSGSTLR